MLEKQPKLLVAFTLNVFTPTDGVIVGFCNDDVNPTGLVVQLQVVAEVPLIQSY